MSEHEFRSEEKSLPNLCDFYSHKTIPDFSDELLSLTLEQTAHWLVTAPRQQLRHVGELRGECRLVGP